MREIKNFVVNSLAATRLTQLVLHDRVLDTPRNKILDHWAPDTYVGYVFWNRCAWCASVWAGVLVSVCSKFKIGQFFLGVLALSETAVIVDKVVDHLDA